MQFRAYNDEPGENLERATNYIENLVEEEVDLVLLPEMFNSGYGTDETTVNNAIEMQEETVEVLSALADYNDIAIVGGMVNRKDGAVFNSTVIMLPYLEPIYYNKTHLFRDEKKAFTPGSEFRSFEYSGVSFGVLMCYEVRIPRNLKKTLSEWSRDSIDSLRFGRERRTIFDVATRARAIENACFVVAASQCGVGRSITSSERAELCLPQAKFL